MTTERHQSVPPPAGTEIVALQRLTEDITGDLDPDERLIAVTLGQRGGGGYRALAWGGVTAAILAAAAMPLFPSARSVVLLVFGVTVLVTMAAMLAQTFRTPRYAVLLTDRRLFVVRTTSSRTPRMRDAPNVLPRHGVSARLDHGWSGASVTLTLTVADGTGPGRLRFGEQYVPAATAVFQSLTGSLTGSETGVPQALPPPTGPALSDHRTRSVLRRYRHGTWLAVLAGVALFIVGALIDDLAQPPAGFFVAVFAVSAALVVAGLYYRIRAAFWHRILSHHPWREFSYSYGERADRTYVQGGTETTWAPTLTMRAGGDPGATLTVRLATAWTRWGWWRLAGWRRAPTGVAWLAGDPAHRVIVAQPGPGRLFSAVIDPASRTATATHSRHPAA